MSRPEHTPNGDPCEHVMPNGEVCSRSASSHRRRERNRIEGRKRPEHVTKGDPCKRCGKPASEHRKKQLIIGIDGEGYTRRVGWRTIKKKFRAHVVKRRVPILEHVYTYLAASTKDELVDEIGDGVRPLTTREIFDFLTQKKFKGAFIAGFSLGYDKTKWFEDLVDEANWLLQNSDKRASRTSPEANRLLGKPEYRKADFGPPRVRLEPRDYGGVEGEPTYFVNNLKTKFSIHRLLTDERGQPLRKWVRRKGERPRKAWKTRGGVIWDLFGFFQTSFVKTLEVWGVDAKKEDLAFVAEQKERRGRFKTIGPKEKEYCRLETRLMASLIETLRGDIEKAGFTLRSFFGAGSIAGAMLKIMGAEHEAAAHDAEGKPRPGFPEAMHDAVDRAFSGGHFEVSRVGPVKGPVYDRDIASAYAYRVLLLPCWKHGRWVRVTHKRELQRAIERAPYALVRYRLPEHPSIELRAANYDADATKLFGDVQLEEKNGWPKCSTEPWGPFPFRLPDGNIIYPVTSPGGWVWKTEFLTGQKYFPNVEPVEAWILKRRHKCRHKPAFARISEWFNLRLDWGKAGKGIVLKKGLASTYGKRAQRVGKAIFGCMVSAGVITSEIRAMLLEAIGRSKDRWNVLSVSTDGLLSLEKLDLPEPEKTGTEEKALAKSTAKKKVYPLGAWEEKPVLKRGVHIIRPGMRFRLRDRDEEGTTARGMGVKVLHKNRLKVSRAWKERPGQKMKIQQPYIFWGAKSCLHQHHTKECLERYRKDKNVPPCNSCPISRDKKYGRWLRPEPRPVSYEPGPKRARFMGELNGKTDWRLATWALDPSSKVLSRRYSKTKKSELAEQGAMLRQIEEEQADQGGIYVLDDGGTPTKDDLEGA